MKPALLNAYAVMLPRLEAEEGMLLRSVVASATGSLKPSDDRMFVRALKRMTRPRRRPVQSLDDLAAAGVEVVRGDG